MLNMLLSEVAACTGGELRGSDNRVICVATDSREVKQGALFVAISGNRADGHDYLEQAGMNGAAGALVERFCDVGLAQIKVPSCIRAMGDLAACCRDGYNGTVIGITGSCGKTSTKEMLVSILSRYAKVSATSGNRNNEIGVPLTLFAVDRNDEFAVVEMGAAQQGDIAYLMNIARPDISVITNVRSAHIGRFGDEVTIARTKAEIYGHLRSSGKAVINIDEKYSPDWKSMLATRQFLTCSVADRNADVFASNIVLAKSSSEFALNYSGHAVEIRLPVPGLHNIANAVCAASCALLAGASLRHVAEGLNSYAAVHSRLQHLNGSWGGVLIDDTYNANPASVKAAIDVLEKYAGRRYLVLGDMAELGDESRSCHADIGAYARKNAIDVLLTCGKESVVASEAFGKPALHFTDKRTLAAYLLDHLQTDDTVLVKGSRSSAMEVVVALLEKKAVK